MEALYLDCGARRSQLMRDSLGSTPECMQVTDAESELLDRFDAADLNPLALDPWEAWKVFKGYLHTEVEDDIYDAASVQVDHYHIYFIRQFSQWQGNRDAGILRIVVDLSFSPAKHPFERTEFWTHDFPTLADFASVVEGDSQFQTAMTTPLRQSEVYAQDF